MCLRVLVHTNGRLAHGSFLPNPVLPHLVRHWANSLCSCLPPSPGYYAGDDHRQLEVRHWRGQERKGERERKRSVCSGDAVWRDRDRYTEGDKET